MELFLNFAWALLAISGLCLWLRFDRRDKSERRLAFMALAMLIVIVFPVISVSDDLWSLQNPAETDASVRRDHVTAAPHASFPASAIPTTTFAGLANDYERAIAPLFHASLPVERPATDHIQNRPPPAA
jgi:hypothetical protein